MVSFVDIQILVKSCFFFFYTPYNLNSNTLIPLGSWESSNKWVTMATSSKIKINFFKAPLVPVCNLWMCLPVSWCAQSSLVRCTSASWPPSPGCVWRACSCTSCWWRCLRASSPAGSTITSLGTSPRPWWWASQQPSTTEATAHHERKYSVSVKAELWWGWKSGVW